MKIVFSAIILLVVVAVVGTPYIHFTSKEWVTVEVLDKDRECRTTTNSEGGTSMSCYYVVFTDSEVFHNTDSVFHMKFDSADVQRQLLPGQRYDLLVNGYRIPFLSSFRNILEVHPEGTYTSHIAESAVSY